MTTTTIDPKHTCQACDGDGSWDEHRAGSEDWYEVRCQRCEGRGWMYESEMTDEELAEITHPAQILSECARMVEG